MPHYFFHVEDGQSFPDAEGCQLPDLDAARIEAVRLLGGMLRDEAETFWQGHDWRMSVTDADGMRLFTIDFMAKMVPVLRDMPAPQPAARLGTFGMGAATSAMLGRTAEAAKTLPI